MKLYVWIDPYLVAYGKSMVFSIAENEDDARKLAMSSLAKYYTYGELPDGYPTYIENNKVNFCREKPIIELGKPTRVESIPCAEWHRWEE